MVLVIKNPHANARDIRDAGWNCGLGRSPGGGNSNPMQYSCLVNPMDRGAWQATVHGVTKTQTRLKWLSTHTHKHTDTHTHTCCSFEDGIFVPFWEVWAWRNLCDITKVTELLRTRSKNVLRGFKAFSPLCCAMSCPPIMWNQQAMTSMLSFSFHRSAKRETNRKMDHAEKQTRKMYSTADMTRKGWCPHQSCHIPDAVPWWLQCWPQTACWDMVIFKPLVPVGALSLLPAASFSLGSSLLT